MAIIEAAIELLADLGRRGIEMKADGEQLRYRPIRAMTPDLAEQVKAHKPALLAIVAGDVSQITPDDLPACLRERFEERAGIMEFDANLTRDDAEDKAMRLTLVAIRG
ncbi:MAG: hypothetical protein QUV05_18405 [Phycisphaerae bacterium]|nr:hypothetical protein [Phycisphaerae bacterium]